MTDNRHHRLPPGVDKDAYEEWERPEEDADHPLKVTFAGRPIDEAGVEVGKASPWPLGYLLAAFMGICLGAAGLRVLQHLGVVQ